LKNKKEWLECTLCTEDDDDHCKLLAWDYIKNLGVESNAQDKQRDTFKDDSI
jgi:hypothetical protein